MNGLGTNSHLNNFQRVVSKWNEARRQPASADGQIDHHSDLSLISYEPTGLTRIFEYLLNILTGNLYFSLQSIEVMKDTQEDLATIYFAIEDTQSGSRHFVLSDGQNYTIKNNQGNVEISDAHGNKAVISNTTLPNLKVELAKHFQANFRSYAMDLNESSPESIKNVIPKMAAEMLALEDKFRLENAVGKKNGGFSANDVINSIRHNAFLRQSLNTSCEVAKYTLTDKLKNVFDMPPPPLLMQVLTLLELNSTDQSQRATSLAELEKHLEKWAKRDILDLMGKITLYVYLIPGMQRVANDGLSALLKSSDSGIQGAIKDYLSTALENFKYFPPAIQALVKEQIVSNMESLRSSDEKEEFYDQVNVHRLSLGNVFMEDLASRFLPSVDPKADSSASLSDSYSDSEDGSQ